MASNVRECDICGGVFKVAHISGRKYNLIELPSPQKLERIAKCALDSNIRGYVEIRVCDVCTDCIIAICEAMLARRELEDG